MSNSQDKIFVASYDDFLTLLDEFVTRVLHELPVERLIDGLVGYLVDLYAQSFEDEAETILEALEENLTEVERRNLNNSVSTSAFARSIHNRVSEILRNRASWVIEQRDEYVKEHGVLNMEDIHDKVFYALVMLATSEVHMTIERASVEVAKVLQSLLGGVLYKVWHSQQDDRVCRVCRALDGTRVPVSIPFLKGLNPDDETDYDEIVDYLNYTGGEITYAHPRCRCWVTYEKA